MNIVAANRAGVRQAATAVRREGVIVFPTDTAYGLGGVFDSPIVIRRILQIKGRHDKKFTVIAANQKQVEKFFRLNEKMKQLARRFWPGPLSMVVSSRYAVRVPASVVARQLCRFVGKPLIATSANVSGQPAAYSARTVKQYFVSRRYQPELLLNAGRLKKQKPSTVVKVDGGKIFVIRQGSILL